MSRYHFEAPQVPCLFSSERHAHQRRDPKMQSLYLAAKAKPKGDDEDEDEDEDDVRRRTRRRTTRRRRMRTTTGTSPTAALVRKICPKISLWYLIRLEMIASHHVCRIASDLRRACSGSASTSRPTRPRRSGRPRDENPRVIGPNADSVLDTALYGRAGRIRDSSDAIV